MKNIILSLTVLLGVFLFVPISASADHSLPETVTSTNPEELEHILKELQEKVEMLKGDAGHMKADSHEDNDHCHLDGDLALGASGEEVHCLQAFLIEKGLLKVGEPTGYFGNMTKDAVHEWQEHEGLPTTGYFGAKSRAKWVAMKSGAEAMPSMHHAMVEAPTPAPTVTLEVAKDAKDGFNVHVTTTNFTFAPEHASGAHVAGEGHLHIYVDGKKLGRMYGPWYHVSSSSLGLAKGHHTIKVELSANDHSTYAIAGVGITKEVEVSVGE